MQVPQTQVVPSVPAVPSVDSLAGTYQANYNMKVRSLPDYDATSVSRLTQGSTFVVTNTASGANFLMEIGCAYRMQIKSFVAKYKDFNLIYK